MPVSKRETPWVGLAPKGKRKSSRFDEELIDFGVRIVKLLNSGKAKQNYCGLATLDDLLGAVYALILAMHNEPSFKYRPKGQRIDPHGVLNRARAVAKSHRIRTTGKWMAGFHFNSALFRLLAVYHRALKIVTGQTKTRKHIGNQKDANSLLCVAKKTYLAWENKEWSNENIAEVHAEVNDLKHTATGIYWGRAVNENKAISATRELLTLLEAWAKRH